MTNRQLFVSFATLVALSLFPLRLQSQSNPSNSPGVWPAAGDETVRLVSNGRVTPSESGFSVSQINSHLPIELNLNQSLTFGIARQADQWWVVPVTKTTSEIATNEGIWILPLEATSKSHSWYIKLHGGHATTMASGDEIRIVIQTDRFTVVPAEARPHSDVFGHRFSISLQDGEGFDDALAGFYWGTMLPLVVEKTMASNFHYSSGYVLSTLMTSKYAGSYPAVDHEFQIAGRLAMGSSLDLDIARRMIELQLQLIHDDPQRLYRAPTSVQPDGRREYHIRRNSKDNHQNAAMFPATGNIEVIMEAWHYFEATGDSAWLRSHLSELEHAAGWTQSFIDQYGRIWSDVYYEDQVIKDGRETQAQAFAAKSFDMLAKIERTVGRSSQAMRYQELSKKLANALIQPLPMGYWDEHNHRFTDWVDRDGIAHDHLHLVANTAPVAFGYTTPEQAEEVHKLIKANDQEFQRFPSFVAARVEDYDQSEMGVAGPYDLSAAGRYWYWDAFYRNSLHDGTTLLNQLKAVAREGRKDNYLMGERYDFDHVYYVDGKDFHGAERYFEYPCVFAAVLITDLLGIRKSGAAGISLTPQLPAFGTVRFDTPGYQLQYTYDSSGFSVRNLANKRRSFTVNLDGVGHGGWSMQAPGAHAQHSPTGAVTVLLSPEQEAHWTTTH